MIARHIILVVQRTGWACFFIAAASLARGQVTGPVGLVGASPVAGASAAGASYAPSFSGDGRFVVFVSQANNLVTNDSNLGWLDVFVRDLVSGTTVLVSVSTNGTGGGNGNSYNPVISSNGQFVAFQSAASNLAPVDPNGTNDIYVRDLALGTTTLVSAGVTGTSTGLRPSANPVITPDGRWIAFESAAGNLVTNDANSIPDVFLFDRQTGTMTRVSEGTTHVTGGDDRSFAASLSDDGQRVAFASGAFLSISKPGSKGEIYVRDLTNGTTIWASANVYSNRLSPDIRSFHPALSADGRFVAFLTVFLDGLSPLATNAHFHDLESGVTSLVSSNVSDWDLPEISGDGRFVAVNSETNVVLWDRFTGSNTLVSVDLSGTSPARGRSLRPILSANAIKVAFLSDADNLTTNGGNGMLQLYVRDLVANATVLISARQDGKPGRDLAGILPALNSEGSRVAFASDDELMVPDDLNRLTDVFLRELAGGTTALVSVRHPGVALQTMGGFAMAPAESSSADGRFLVLSGLRAGAGPAGAAPAPGVVRYDSFTGTNAIVTAVGPLNASNATPVISANGRFVAYVAPASGGMPPFDQAYLWDAQTQVSSTVSRRWEGGGDGTGASTAPSVSGDGRMVAFQSDAPDIVPDDTNGFTDVFVRDLDLGTNLLVSVRRTGPAAGNNISTKPVISRDGRWVVFQSLATDLVANVLGGGVVRLYARDLVSRTTALVSVDNWGVGASGVVGTPDLNSSGERVLFSASGDLVFIHDLVARTNAPVCSPCSNPAMSADGRWVVYEGRWGSNSVRDIILKDLHTGLASLVSVNHTNSGGGDRASSNPAISGNGRFIVFASKADNLVENDTNGFSDIFVRDRVLSTTLLVSLNRQGTGAGSGSSTRPVLGADGRTVTFDSFAPDLVDGDLNGARDVFLLRLSAADSDGDGMDDDWETAYFNDLSRDGKGDFDGDGQSDLFEFVAGTDPTNTGSVLRVLRLDRMGGETMLIWSATPGTRYRVQFKDVVNAMAWTDLPGVITASGTSASRLDDSGTGGAQRCYRVVVVP